MKRYDAHTYEREESDQGTFVLYADYTARLTEVEAELEHVLAKLDCVRAATFTLTGDDYTTNVQLRARLVKIEQEYRSLYKEHAQLSSDFVSREDWDNLHERNMGIENTLKSVIERAEASERVITRAQPAGVEAHDALYQTLLDEARAIIDTAHMAESNHPGTVRDWHERRQAWLERCKELGK